MNFIWLRQTCCQRLRYITPEGFRLEERLSGSTYIKLANTQSFFPLSSSLVCLPCRPVVFLIVKQARTVHRRSVIAKILPGSDTLRQRKYMHIVNDGGVQACVRKIFYHFVGVRAAAKQLR